MGIASSGVKNRPWAASLEAALSCCADAKRRGRCNRIGRIGGDQMLQWRGCPERGVTGSPRGASSETSASGTSSSAFLRRALGAFMGTACEVDREGHEDEKLMTAVISRPNFMSGTVQGEDEGVRNRSLPMTAVQGLMIPSTRASTMFEAAPMMTPTAKLDDVTAR